MDQNECIAKSLEMTNVSSQYFQVDRLEESEAARLEEKKEEQYKPVVMGKPNIHSSTKFIHFLL